MADAHQQMALVKEAEAQGHKHPLFNLASRCSVLLRARSALNATVKLLKDKIEEYDRDVNNYLVGSRKIFPLEMRFDYYYLYLSQKMFNNFLGVKGA